MKPKNYWKYIIFTLVAFVVIFHIGAIIYIQQGPNFELTSRDYYERGQSYESEIQAVQRGRTLNWQLDFNKDGQVIAELSPLPTGTEVEIEQIQMITLELQRPNRSEWDRMLTLERVQETSSPVTDGDEGATGESVDDASDPVHRFVHDSVLQAGRWRVRASFEWNELQYLYKTAIVVP